LIIDVLTRTILLLNLIAKIED